MSEVDHQADYTPLGVVRQILGTLDISPSTILDPSTGAGAWARVAKERWPGAYIESFEIRPEEQRGRQYADAFHLQGFERGVCRKEAYDLIATNPPFKYATEWVPDMLALLEPGGLLVWYGLSNLGQRSKASRDLFRTSSPILQLRIAGGVRHRMTGSGDQRDVSAWIWRKGASPDGWVCRNLPEMGSKQRSIRYD